MTQAICFKNKFGYCKYSDNCRYKHVTLVCEDGQCDIQKCEKRHPKICKYFRDFRRCKFTVGCRYKHENQNELFEKLKKKIENLEQNMVENANNTDTNKIEQKFKEMEMKVEKQQKEIEEKSSQIACLELRLDELEKKFANEKKAKDKKIKDLEKVLINKTPKLDKENFKCEHCDYETSSERGLNIHIKRKHTNLDTNNYPVDCDFCDFKLNSESEMKFHLKNEHTSTYSSFKCLDCDFCADSEITIQVHQGRCHGGGFECGICDFRADSLKNLNIHLNTCESFECFKCCVRVYNISDMKKHINEKHADEEYLTIRHGKIDRKNSEYVKETNYNKNDLQ